MHARVDLNQPFANTPAASWADGAAGIALPPAQPVFQFSAEQVADAEAKVKQVLIAAHLDPAVLVQHDLSGYLAQFARTDQDDIRADLTPGKDVALSFVTMIAPGHHLLPAAPKVNGSMSASVDDRGNLLVHTNYVFAYAFADARPEDVVRAMDIVAVAHYQADFRLVTSSRYPEAARGLWHAAMTAYMYSMSCADKDNGYLAPSYGAPRDPDRRPTTQDSNPDSFFDPAHPMDTKGSCHPERSGSRPPTTTTAPPTTLVTA